MIKYLGSKRLLLPRITALVRGMRGVRTALDLFSGTSRVAFALKQLGLVVTANDHLEYAATLARGHVEADADRVTRAAERLIGELSRLPGAPGYFTETFCERSRFLHPKNGARVDAIRERIESLAVDEPLRSVLLVSLMEAADRVDSTTGLQMAYLKSWAARAHKPLELRLPAILPGPGRATQLDAEEAAGRFEADLVYLDPPYNQHRYLGNYHVWESLVRWDKPGVYGVACKREDCRDYRSAFNSRPGILPALERVVARLRCRHLVVSFSNEGYVTREAMEALLATRGHVATVEVDFPRYVGARIGIHDPAGRKVGRVSHLRNREYLFVVGESSRALEPVLASLSARARDTVGATA
ncbi:MAG: DNA adenine methylase [Candidatus Eisenbacteria bacterium]